MKNFEIKTDHQTEIKKGWGVYDAIRNFLSNSPFEDFTIRLVGPKQIVDGDYQIFSVDYENHPEYNFTLTAKKVDFTKAAVRA